MTNHTTFISTSQGGNYPPAPRRNRSMRRIRIELTCPQCFAMRGGRESRMLRSSGVKGENRHLSPQDK